MQHELIKAAVYFIDGSIVYAASNVKTFRLREYVLKANLASAEVLDRSSNGQSDLALAQSLCTQNLLKPDIADQIQARQVSDILRLAMQWMEGTWEFDYRSRLNEEVGFSVDVPSLILEAARHTPAEFAAARFKNPAEMISPSETYSSELNLLPAEGFLLSRLDHPTSLKELLTLSVASELETLHMIYILALTGFIHRERWKSSFRDPSPAVQATSSTSKTQPKLEPPPTKATVAEEIVDESELLKRFLERLDSASSHYEVLGVERNNSAEDLKTIYYKLAKRYHPDRFQRSEPSLKLQVETAFARITQAYDVLRDAKLRASYDSKLEARIKAQELAKAAPTAEPVPKAPEEKVAEAKPESTGPSIADQAEARFKEGFAAFELGQHNVATGLFAAAAQAIPNEPRYHAYYGRALAKQENTRRKAEAEFLAALKLDPNNADYRLMLAELYRDLGLKLRAKGECDRALASSPGNPKVREFLKTLK